MLNKRRSSDLTIESSEVSDESDGKSSEYDEEDVADTTSVTVDSTVTGTTSVTMNTSIDYDTRKTLRAEKKEERDRQRANAIENAINEEEEMDFETKKARADEEKEKAAKDIINFMSDSDLSESELARRNAEREANKIEMYPYYLLPMLWCVHPQKALRHKLCCLVNLVFFGTFTYYFILVNVSVDNEYATQFLWLAPTIVCFITAWQLRSVDKLRKLLIKLAKSVQITLDLQNDMAKYINGLGEKIKQYTSEVVALGGVIHNTKKTRRRLSWRNKQGEQEVEEVENIIMISKETEGPKIKTEGVLVEMRLQLGGRREELEKSIEDHFKKLEEVKDEVTDLQNYQTDLKEEAKGFTETLDQLQGTVGDLQNRMGKMEELRVYSQNLDATAEDHEEYKREIRETRDGLRRLTMIMEMGITRQIGYNLLHDAGESGIDRDHFTLFIERVPAAVKRAMDNMGNKATFDHVRVQSKTKIMDHKWGRKKRPGVDRRHLRAFFLELEAALEATIDQPLGSLLGSPEET